MLHELEENVEKEIAELKVTVEKKDAEIEKVRLPSFTSKDGIHPSNFTSTLSLFL